MTRRILMLGALVGCGFLPHRMGAQTASPANRKGQTIHYHYDEADPAPLSTKTVDGVLADLAPKLAEVKLKSGALEVEGLKKALQGGLQGLRPPGKLKFMSSAVCDVVDPQDRGGYWEGLSTDFSHWLPDDAWQKKLDVDEKKYALSKPPLVEMKYKMYGKFFDEGTNNRPFRREVCVAASYYILATVTLTFDEQVVADGTSRTLTGVSSGDMQPYELKTTISLADRTEMIH